MKSIFYLLVIILFIDSDNSIEKTVEISPGVTHIHIINKEKPWNINILKIDLARKDLKLQSATAFDSVAGNETVSSIVKRVRNKEVEVVAAINADFYEDGGYSSNALVKNGILVKSAGNFSAFGSTSKKDLHIGRIKYQSWLARDSFKVKIDDSNRVRGENEIILYNNFYGKSTRSNRWGSEFLLNYLDLPMVNDTIKAVIIDEIENIGNMVFKKNMPVISAHNKMGQLLSEKFAPGDTIDIFIGLKGMPAKIESLVGGFVHLVRNGKNNVDKSFAEEGKPEIQDRFVSFRHPRTAIGYSEDEKIFYMFTVDGRQPSSAGMTLYELADFMLHLGVWEALNMGGGGSTTMLIGNNVVNSPSDAGGERAVSNALLLIKE